jgi:4,4'-diaponeurosporenoate glycosyltransferase
MTLPLLPDLPTWFPFGSGLLAAGWLLGWVLMWRLPRLNSTARPHPGLRVSVIVPARNRRRPGVWADLQAPATADEIIVVDDGSTDGTARVAARVPAVRVLTAPAVPEGWTGKSWACHTGALAAAGQVLVFLDADVELAPEALAAVVHRWEVQGGLVSVQPQHRIRRRVEALSLPFNVITMMGRGVGSLVRPRREWAAGPCLVSSATDYWAVDGHRAVRHQVAEDLALAEQFGGAGLPVHCLGGHDLIGFRMYRDLPGLVEGWTKNLATGATRTPMVRGLAVAAWLSSLLTVALATVSPGAPVWSVLVGDGAAGGDLAGAVLAYALVAAQLAVQARQVGRFRGGPPLAGPARRVRRRVRLVHPPHRPGSSGALERAPSTWPPGLTGADPCSSP